MNEAVTRRRFVHQGAATAAGVAVALTNPQPTQAEPMTPPQSIADPDTLRQRVQTSLGGPWPEPCPLNPRVAKREQRDGYRLEWLDYEVEPGDRVPAILLVPDGVDAEHPAPGIAVWHQHAGQYHLGKSEPAGLAGNPMHHTGVALCREGYVVLCPDALCFEERQDPDEKLKGHWFERFEFLRHVVDGRCMAWKNILDMRRAVDYLAGRGEVDADLLGCYGHSMGSTHTWLVGPFEPRLKCLVGNCCLPTYAGIHRTKILHCFPNFIPGLAEYGDTPLLCGLIAPRALHLNFGEDDAGSPIPEVKEGTELIARMYAAADAAERFTHFIEPGAGHVLSEAMWQRTRDCFEKHLKG